MEIQQKEKEIIELIARKIVYGLTEQEESVLQEWLILSEQNRELYKKLISREQIISYEQRLNKINISRYRDEMEKVIGIQQLRRITFLKYSAVAILLLLLGTTALYWQLRGDKHIDNVVVVQQKKIKPGAQKALLVLADGQEVDLAAINNHSIEVEGIEVSRERAIIKGHSNKQETTWNKIITPRGGEYCLELSDGTVVYINSESQLEFPVTFNGKNREVYLKGEAYFKVAKSTEHPFIVQTEKMNILVTGTEFNIKAYHGEKLVQATLVEGAVSVATGVGKQQTHILKPSQQAQLNLEKNITEVQNVDVSSFIAWKNGQFIFKGDRLEDIMITLSRWYDFEVFYLNNSVKDIVFAGKLNRMDAINPILDIMASTQKINVEIKGKTIVLSTK